MKTGDPDLSRSVEDYPTIDHYALAMATLADADVPVEIVGAEPASVDCQYGVEPEPGALVHQERIDELRDAINALPNYRAGARIIVRTVQYGPWRYVPAGVIAAFLEDEAAAAGDGRVP
jgi:hypothetical protein